MLGTVFVVDFAIIIKLIVASSLEEGCREVMRRSGCVCSCVGLQELGINYKFWKDFEEIFTVDSV